MLLVNVDVRIDHISDHIGVMSHSTLKNIHSGRDSMRRKAEYDSTANTKLPDTLKTTNPQQQGFCFSFFCFPTAFLSSGTGVSMSVTFDTAGGSPGPHVCTFHTSSHTLFYDTFAPTFGRISLFKFYHQTSFGHRNSSQNPL